MSRHFDNITTLANYEYISSIVAIAINIIIAVSVKCISGTANATKHRFLLHPRTYILQLFKDKRKPTQAEIDYIRSFSQFIEVTYDPFLTWRNFLCGRFADHRRIWQNVVNLHVELVPFIYGKTHRRANWLFMGDTT